MGWSFKARLREHGIVSEDIPLIAIDLHKTFVDQPHFKTKFATFFFLNGKEVRHSWRIWKHGWDAYNELAIECTFSALRTFRAPRDSAILH